LIIRIRNTETGTTTVLFGKQCRLETAPQRDFLLLTIGGSSMMLPFNVSKITITPDENRIDAVVNGVHCPNCSRIAVDCADLNVDFSDEQFVFSFYSCHLEGDVTIEVLNQ
jgi:hypothetical protein